MTKGIVIALSASAFIASIAVGQMKYSRPRSQQSPTPTPTPLQVIPPKEAAVRSQPQRPTLTPTPSRQTFGQPQAAMQRPTPVPTPAKQAYLQPQKPTPTPTPSRQTFGQPQSAMQKPTPIPTPAKQAYLQPQRPAATLPSPQQTFRRAQVLPQAMTPAPIPAKPTPTPVPPPDIQAYLDRQLASSKDRKYHLNANGKDLPLTPFHVWRQKEIGPNSTSTCVDMRSDEGRVYDIDFVTTGKDVTGVKVHRINGETVR